MLLGALKSRISFFLQLSQSAAETESRIFWRVFGSSCSSGLLSLVYYALQSVLQPLFHTFTWMKMPKLVCVQLFNKQTLEPRRQKKKKRRYTSLMHFSKEKGRKLAADWNPSLSLLVLRAPEFLELRALLCRSLKVRPVAADMEQAADCSLSCETWINSGSQDTALSTRHLHGLHDKVCPTRGLPWGQWHQYSCGSYTLLQPY